VCDNCCEHVDWGAELLKDMRQKEGTTEVGVPWGRVTGGRPRVGTGHGLLSTLPALGAVGTEFLGG
jgi:hypothetical protein